MNKNYPIWKQDIKTEEKFTDPGETCGKTASVSLYIDPQKEGRTKTGQKK